MEKYHVFDMEGSQCSSGDFLSAHCFSDPFFDTQYFDWNESLRLAEQDHGGNAPSESSMVFVNEPGDVQSHVSTPVSEPDCVPDVATSYLAWTCETASPRFAEPMVEDHNAPASPKDEQRHVASPYTKTSRSRRKSAPSLPSTTSPKSNRNARRSARLSQQRQGSNNKPQDFRRTGPMLHYPGYDGSIAAAVNPSSGISPAKPFSSSVDSSDGPPVRRVPHKAVERRYRESMKTMFDRLRSVVPAPKNKCSSSTGISSGGGGPDNTDGDIVFVDSAAADLPPSSPLSSLSASSSSSSPTRLTKAGVMSRAVEYIEEMEAEIERMRACYAGALQENERLKHAALELETRLSIPHCGGFGGAPGNECCAIT